LERAGLIEPYLVLQAEIRDLLEVARRDVKTAQELMNIDLDWALIVAYNAALQAGLALRNLLPCLLTSFEKDFQICSPCARSGPWSAAPTAQSGVENR